MGGHDYVFETSNYKIKTTPCSEWLYVVGDDKLDRKPCPDMGHERRIVPIKELMERPLAKKAGLLEEEMIAVVLYTGPMFAVYNGILRQFPKQLYNSFREKDNLFSTTIFVLVSAVQKLSRCMKIPDGMMLYRGLGGTLELPDNFSIADENGCKGYCDFGFMSTTAERAVAVMYSGEKDKKPHASIMEIHPNSVDRGADISEFSQYPGEREFLFVPMSFVQAKERCRSYRVEVGPNGGVLKVISVSVNINLKTETVEQLKSKKKDMHISAFKSVIDETKRFMHSYALEGDRVTQRAAFDQQYKDIPENEKECDISHFITTTLNQMQRIKDGDLNLDDDYYVDDLKYKLLVTRMLSVQACAKQKLWLWLENLKTSINVVNNLDLKSAHAQWLSFLQQQYDIAGSCERKAAAVRILQCKGLMVTDNAATEKFDDEPLIIVAAADGWALEDVKV